MIEITIDQKEFMQGEPQLLTVKLSEDLVEKKTVLPRALFKKTNLTLIFAEPVEPMQKPEDQAIVAIPKQDFYKGIAAYLINNYFNTHTPATYTLKAVLKTPEGSIESKAITYTVHAADSSLEEEAFGRLHHFPWANYVSNKYCGDTFDLVHRWPESRLAKYCDYYSGRFLLEQRDYNGALEKFENVITQNEPFALTSDTEVQIAVCLMNIGEKDKAKKQLEKVQSQYKQTPATEDAQRKN